MIESILDSKVKMRIAKLFADRRESYQVSDVSRILRVSKSRASKCLRELAKNGVLESTAVGRSVVYRLAQNTLAKSISTALTQEKAILAKIEKRVAIECKKLGAVGLVLFGSSLRGLRLGKDVDFLLLCNDEINKEDIYRLSGNLTGEFGFHISILVMNIDEFRNKAKRGEEFVLNVLANHKLLYGKALEGVVWQEK